MNKQIAFIGLLVVTVGSAFASGYFWEKSQNQLKQKREYLRGMNDGLEFAKGLVVQVFEQEKDLHKVLKEEKEQQGTES